MDCYAADTVRAIVGDTLRILQIGSGEAAGSPWGPSEHITLAAVIIGPIATLLLGLIQFRASARAEANRRLDAEIQDLRHLISEFMSEAGLLALKLDPLTKKAIDVDFHLARAKTTSKLQAEITMALNPADELHQKIFEHVDQVRQAAVRRELARMDVISNELLSETGSLFERMRRDSRRISLFS